jgi:hypothetical protein
VHKGMKLGLATDNSYFVLPKSYLQHASRQARLRSARAFP